MSRKRRRTGTAGQANTTERTAVTETVDASVEPAQEQVKACDTACVKIADMEPDFSDIEVKNPRIGKVMKLEEEAKRQSEIEKLRARRIRQEQEYIDQMSLSVESHKGGAAV